MQTCNIAILPGDGIGKEIMPQAVNVLKTAAEVTSAFELRTETFPWGAEHFLKTGEFMPANGLDILNGFDAILFVACGHPDVTDFRSSWEFVFVIRKGFKQYVNIRPAKSYQGVPTLLTSPDAIDMAIVRENSEGEYAGPGGVVHGDFSNAVAIQTSVFTREGVERIARYSFELARERRNHVTNITKSNAILHSMVFWDDIIDGVSRDYPDVEYDFLLVDAASMKFVQNPGFFDVLVTTNMYGDILSDLGGAMVGSIGLSASGNINPEGDYPSMYEPVHGSAPDIAGQGIANPIGTILSGGLMLKDLGQPEAAGMIQQAVADVLQSGCENTRSGRHSFHRSDGHGDLRGNEDVTDDQVVIRTAQPDDALAIAQVHVATWQTAYRGILPDNVLADLKVSQRQRQWQQAIAENQLLIVAEIGDEIVGFVNGGARHSDVPDFDCEVYALYILQTHQGQGIRAQVDERPRQ